jgi:hypothetical protein
MGHRLTTALILLNAMGLFACLILIARTATRRLTLQYTSPVRSNSRSECLSLELHFR